MTIDQYKKATVLTREIFALEEEISRVKENMRNPSPFGFSEIPEMKECLRQCAETCRNILCKEKQRLEDELASL